MAGMNLTGLPQTGNYNLGRGKLYLAELVNGLPGPGGWRDLGNAPEFNVNVEVETLEHQSSREGLKTVDKEVVISQKIGLTFQLDEINFQNLALFFSGSSTAAALTNPAIAGVVAKQITSALALGVWYDLTSEDGQAGIRVYDIDKTNLVLTEDPGGTPQVLVQDTDYLVDEKMGRVFITTTGAATVTDELDYTLAADAGAVDPDEVKSLTQTNVTAALKFISENPADNDKQTEYKFHQVQLKADGDFALIGDEFTTMGFTAVSESNIVADADSPFVTVRTHANA